MIAIILFSTMYLFAAMAYVYRNKIIDGLEATAQVDDVRALAHWEGMIIESKTAQEKMVYMRLADEVKAKLIREAKASIANSTATGAAFTHARPPATKKPADTEAPAANVVLLADRKRNVN